MMAILVRLLRAAVCTLGTPGARGRGGGWDRAYTNSRQPRRKYDLPTDACQYPQKSLAPTVCMQKVKQDARRLGTKRGVAFQIA